MTLSFYDPDQGDMEYVIDMINEIKIQEWETVSQSNSNPVKVQLVGHFPYRAKTDGRSRKFPKGTKVVVLLARHDRLW